jgi:FtsH-binding integral membrane protein
MSFGSENPYASPYHPTSFAALAGESERTTFIRRTYLHLAGAVFAFIAIEAVVFSALSDQTLMNITRWMVGGYNWLLVLGGFFVVSVVADRWARSAASLGMQYAGLALYVAAEAVIFVPILLLASHFGRAHGENVIATAGLMTAVVFGGLTVLVFATRADLSWLGRYLGLIAIIALGFIVVSIFFDMHVGNWFAALMVALAAGYILYYTSNIMHHYRTDQYVAASLALFASVALLFWYILQLVMNRD